MNRYRIIRTSEWPREVRAQVKRRWLPGWRTLLCCGASEEWAREAIENHRAHGTVHSVLHCDPRTPEAE